MEFTQIFLLTYQSFTTPKKLLSKLIQRYLIPVRANLDEKSIQTIQLRVCNVIQKWIELSFFDFDEESTKMLNEFISSIMLPDLGKRLNKAIQNQVIILKTIQILLFNLSYLLEYGKKSYKKTIYIYSAIFECNL